MKVLLIDDHTLFRVGLEGLLIYKWRMITPYSGLA